MVINLLKIICGTIYYILALNRSTASATSRSLEMEYNISESEVTTKSEAKIVSMITEYSALNKPINVTWKVDGQYLEVSWLHSNLLQSIEGYYVSLCAWYQTTCGPPEFIHFSKEKVNGRILGLAPDSNYILKVRLMLYMTYFYYYSFSFFSKTIY